MKETIYKRKSIRKFDMTALDPSELKKVEDFIKAVKPLDPAIEYSIEFTTKTKGLFNIKAPHYMVLKSEKKTLSNENIGFIGQQIDLFLSANGLGGCWLGLAKEADIKSSGLPHVICIAFGKPAEPLHRETSQFKRKSLESISRGNDVRIEGARLAPSGMNRQNWFFVLDGTKIHCYRKKPDLISGMFFGELEAIDIGIAICHIYAESKNFAFQVEENPPQEKGFIYVGTADDEA